MSKRRVFDIDFPSDTPAPKPERTADPVARRSPMASAITENADALQARAEAEQAIRAENDRLAHEHVRLKKAGLITDVIPLDQVLTTKLMRDRSLGVDPDLDELKASIRAVGLSNPIRVEPAGFEKFELIQGSRRLAAYRALFEETGDPAFAQIPAAMVARGEALEKLYRKMVDENLVRRDVSLSEMAQLALDYVQDAGIETKNLDEAIATLYGSAARQKRSYIRRFAVLVPAITGYANFPAAIPRALGLDLAKKLDEEHDFGPALRGHLASQNAQTAEAEVDSLRVFLKSWAKKPKGKAPPKSRAKTTLRCDLPDGPLKVTASHGRVELMMERDFASLDRAKLEAAVEAFMDALRD